MGTAASCPVARGTSRHAAAASVNQAGVADWQATASIRVNEVNASGRLRTSVTHTARPAVTQRRQISLPVLLLVGQHEVRGELDNPGQIGVLRAADAGHVQDRPGGYTTWSPRPGHPGSWRPPIRSATERATPPGGRRQAP